MKIIYQQAFMLGISQFGVQTLKGYSCEYTDRI